MMKKASLLVFLIPMVYGQQSFSFEVITLETERLILDPVVVTDTSGLANIALDPVINERTGLFPKLDGIEDVERFTKDFLVGNKEAGISSKYPKSWKVIEKTTGHMIGLFVFVSYSERHRKGEIGYAFNQKYWNKGYATEACNAIIKHAFDSGLIRLSATVDPENVPSERVLQKSHMKLEGLLEKYMIVNEKPVDRKLYAITAHTSDK